MILTTALKAMQKKAKDLGLTKGMVVIRKKVSILKMEFHSLPIGTGAIREPDTENRGPDDMGTNYLAFAIGKIFQSMRTGQPSCAENAMKGESAARGCVLSTNGTKTVYFSCSGGTEDEDVIVATAGKKLYEKYTKK